MIVTVDTGGTKTLVASFSKDGTLIEQTKFATPQDSKEYIKILQDTITEKYKDQVIDIVVIGTPGLIENGIIIWGGGNLPWENFDITSELGSILGKTPILVENDAKLAGLYEARILNPIPPQVLYVTISTGIGSGIITDGHINQALRKSEAGHAIIEFEGVPQEWEKFASGKAIYNKYGKYARDIDDQQTWDQIIDRISLGFLEIIPTLQPDIVVIGGSMGTYFDKFGKKLQDLLTKKLPPHIPCPNFIPAENSELAVIYGCYYYALDNFPDISA